MCIDIYRLLLFREGDKRSRGSIQRNKKSSGKRQTVDRLIFSASTWRRGRVSLCPYQPRTPPWIGRSVCLSLGKANGVVWVPVAPGDAQTSLSPPVVTLHFPFLYSLSLSAIRSRRRPELQLQQQRLLLPLIIGENRKTQLREERWKERRNARVLAAIQTLILVFHEKSRDRPTDCPFPMTTATSSFP